MIFHLKIALFLSILFNIRLLAEGSSKWSPLRTNNFPVTTSELQDLIDAYYADSWARSNFEITGVRSTFEFNGKINPSGSKGYQLVGTSNGVMIYSRGIINPNFPDSITNFGCNPMDGIGLSRDAYNDAMTLLPDWSSAGATHEAFVQIPNGQKVMLSQFGEVASQSGNYLPGNSGLQVEIPKKEIRISPVRLRNGLPVTYEGGMPPHFSFLRRPLTPAQRGYIALPIITVPQPQTSARIRLAAPESYVPKQPLGPGAKLLRGLELVGPVVEFMGALNDYADETQQRRLNAQLANGVQMTYFTSQMRELDGLENMNYSAKQRRLRELEMTGLYIREGDNLRPRPATQYQIPDGPSLPGFAADYLGKVGGACRALINGPASRYDSPDTFINSNIEPCSTIQSN